MITTANINIIKNKIIELEAPKKIILFGSYGRDDARDKSDLDLMVIKETNDPIYKRGIDLRWFLGAMPFNIDLLIKTPKEFKKWQDVDISFNATVAKEGKVLYEQKI